MNKCRLIGNSAEKAGGGINLAQENILTLLDSLLEENSAVEVGGALQSSIDNTLYLHSLTFIQNFAGVIGGALCLQSNSRVHIVGNTSFAENSAERVDGAIAVVDSLLWTLYNEPQYWYWEIVETTRRLMLTAVLSICGAGTSAQSIFAVLLALVYIKLYGYYAPYESDNDDVIAEVGQFQIFFSFLGALIYQKSLLGDEWSVAVSISLIAVNACVSILFTYYAALDLTAQIDEYKEHHSNDKGLSPEETRRAAALEMELMRISPQISLDFNINAEWSDEESEEYTTPKESSKNIPQRQYQQNQFSSLPSEDLQPSECFLPDQKFAASFNHACQRL